MSDIKLALSIKQPWAWAILNGKNIENRTWPTKFRGSFWIHAAKGMSKAYYNEAKIYIEQYGLKVPEKKDLVFGGIIGRANLINVIPPVYNPTIEWHMPEQYGFVLNNIIKTDFVPCSGALGFWKVPENILERLA